ncbi:hypothetical protein EJ03DRAFT_40858 [Teratosphaeria nubilosa]|uniref:Uncharacterized protein n=1 Tax=Teratosphaeria nubilosa TaxID=161662 RepID=A0A6G1KTY8_9PEZI|nr:hypothetical protein EJ03DRAFT_40858 [Teratosphaeria nubilosa]
MESHDWKSTPSHKSRPERYNSITEPKRTPPPRYVTVQSLHTRNPSITTMAANNTRDTFSQHRRSLRNMSSVPAAFGDGSKYRSEHFQVRESFRTITLQDHNHCNKGPSSFSLLHKQSISARQKRRSQSIRILHAREQTRRQDRRKLRDSLSLERNAMPNTLLSKILDAPGRQLYIIPRSQQSGNVRASNASFCRELCGREAMLFWPSGWRILGVKRNHALHTRAKDWCEGVAVAVTMLYE